MSVDVSSLQVRATLESDMAAGAAKARAELGSIGAEVEALDAKGTKIAGSGGGLGAIDQRLTTMNKSATEAGGKLKEMGSSIFDLAAEGAKRLAEALGLVQGGLAAIGVESAVATSKLNTSLTTYLGSATQAATATKQIQSMALGSMSVGVLGQANTQFLSGGMSEAESLKLLSGVQNIAAAQPGNPGQAVSAMSSSLNMLIGSNEVSGRQLRQFSRYFDVYGMMSQQLGVPRSLVRQMLETDAPAIGTGQFLGDIANLSGPVLSRYRGALGRYKQSPMGSIDVAAHSLEDQANNRIGTPLLRGITPLAQGASAGINRFFNQDWGSIAAGATQLGHALVADVMPGLRSIGHDVGPVVSDFEKLAPIIPPLAGAFVNTGAALVNLGKDVANVVMPVAGPLVAFVLDLYNHIGPLHDAVAIFLGGLTGFFILSKIRVWVLDLIKPMVGLRDAILGVGAAEEGLAAKTGLATAAEQAQTETMMLGTGAATTAEGAAAGGMFGRLGLSGAALGRAGGIAMLGSMGADAAGNFVGSHIHGKGGSRAKEDVSDVLRGAALGASLGSIVPGIGTLLGGLGGGIIGGGVAGYQQLFGSGRITGPAQVHHNTPVVVTVNAQGNPNAALIGQHVQTGVKKALDQVTRNQQERS